MAKNKSISEIICDYIKKQKLSPIPVQTLNEEAASTRYFGGDLTPQEYEEVLELARQENQSMS